MGQNVAYDHSVIDDLRKVILPLTTVNPWMGLFRFSLLGILSINSIICCS